MSDEPDPWEVPSDPPALPAPGDTEPAPEDLHAITRDKEEFLAPAPAQEVRPRRAGRDREDLQRKVTYLPDVHRLLPQSPDAERGVLSSFLLLPREVGGMCAEKYIEGEHFFIPAHRLIYERMMQLWDANKEIDLITLTQDFRDRQMLDQCGGAAFITELYTFLPTAANCAYYIEILEEKFVLREIIKRCTEYAARGYDSQDEVPQLLNDAEEGILAIREGGRTSKTIRGPKDGVVEAVAKIEELYSSRGTITGLATGFADIDKETDGLHGGEMIVIAARPSMGKTALAMNMADYLAVDLKKPVLVFSLEMSYGQLMQRALCSRARVNLRRVREGFLSERDFPALQRAASEIAESKLFIDDTAGLNIQELRAKARRFKRSHGIQAIFIDYLQLLHGTSKRAQENRQQEVSEVSSGLKELAKELDIPIVVLAQLSRKADDRERPVLSDLRESGAIEQDADLVGFLIREEYYATTDEERHESAGKATFYIAKQRNGDIGPIQLTFLKEFTRFETRARDYDGGEPEPETGRLFT